MSNISELVYYKLSNDFYTILNNNNKAYDYNIKLSTTNNANKLNNKLKKLYDFYLEKLGPHGINIPTIYNSNIDELDKLINVKYLRTNILSLFDLDTVYNIIVCFTTVNIKYFDIHSIDIKKNNSSGSNSKKIKTYKEKFQNTISPIIFGDQSFVNLETIEYYKTHPELLNLPVIVEYNDGKFYIADGFHRVAYNKIFNPDNEIPIVLIDLNNDFNPYDNKHSRSSKSSSSSSSSKRAKKILKKY